MYANYDRYGVSWGSALVLGAVWGREPRTLRQYIQELARREQKGCLSDWNIRQGGYIFICVVVDEQSRKLTRITTDRDLYRSIIARG